MVLPNHMTTAMTLLQLASFWIVPLMICAEIDIDSTKHH